MKTALYDRHLALGAKMVEFCGWEMPIQYTAGLIKEHLNVREKAGIFDISHMGRIHITGRDAELFLDYLSTNKISGKADGSATYTVFCNAGGRCLDDLIIYKLDSQHYFAVANAANRDKDLKHMLNEAKNFKVNIQDYFQDGILAVQGPLAQKMASRYFPGLENLKPMQLITSTFKNAQIYVTTTGYTGSGGCEIYGPSQSIVELWDLFLNDFKEEGMLPIGLGARDTLRLEKGFALYGHEISEEISPNESVSSWTIKWKKEKFLGKEAMQKLEESPQKRSEYGIILQDRGIARENYAVFKDEKMIGRVTSGTFSPSLNKSIAIILVEGPMAIGGNVEIQIRQNRCKAQVVPLPFL